MSITVPGMSPNSSWVTFSNDKTIHAKVTFLYGLTGSGGLQCGGRIMDGTILSLEVLLVKASRKRGSDEAQAGSAGIRPPPRCRL